jgi:hypothetical protein
MGRYYEKKKKKESYRRRCESAYRIKLIKSRDQWQALV